jgi:cytoskeleton protein RodZ
MSESEQAPVGQVLREAREAQGIKLEEAAARLRLMRRQIEAMESDDFESLGQPVFARGFVRNYARLLGLPPDALLVRMEGLAAEPAAAVRHPEPLPRRSWMASPWAMLLLLGLLLVVATPVSLYWWLNKGEDDLAGRMPSAVRVEPFPLTVTAPATVPVDASAPAAQPAAGQPAVPAAAPEPDEGAPSALPASSSGGALHFEFGGDVWVEVKDAGGRVLHRQLNLAGSRADVRGQPPFDLVIGNAAQTRMTYNGRPVDLTPFTDMTVARFRFKE